MRLFGTPLGWIMWAIYALVKNYGLALILFTVIVKAALFPLSIKQQKSSAKMAVFQPKIAEIQKKYANNKQKQQEELMKLYEDHGYNPMSGCLPMLIQFPILFGVIDVVYYPLTHILHLDKDVITALSDVVTANLGKIGQPELQVISAVQNPETYGWFSSIAPDVLDKITNFDYSLFGLDLGLTPSFGWNLLALVPILAGITSLAVSILSMKLSPTGEQSAGGMMKGMMYFMPLMSVWIAFSMPVGVGIYWIISNLLAGAQSVILHYMYNPAKYREEYEAQLREEEARKKQEREQRKKKRTEAAGAEEEDEESPRPKKKKKPAGEEPAEEGPKRDPQAEYLTAKEINRRRLAEARRRDAEKYGEEYIEVTDDDLR